ncbi:MAG: rod shape-determining protein MreB, partial [Oscillospiraceae bacterium]|nr:rod shape-determining protein MreB [Oscillospiraceae bacterium]
MITSRDIGIDLGTATVILCARGKGVIAREPSVVAMDRSTGRILKVGVQAERMLGRTPGNIAAIHPISGGVISDFEMTEYMIKELIKRVVNFSLVKPRVLISVPSGITEVEERAVVDAAINAGARRVYLIEEAMAAAVGAGVDISKAEGNLVVDVGAGTTEIAVLSLNGVVECTSIRYAGDAFDEAVIKYIRKKHSLLIGKTTAEELKMSIGCVFPKTEEE